MKTVLLENARFINRKEKISDHLKKQPRWQATREKHRFGPWMTSPFVARQNRVKAIPYRIGLDSWQISSGGPRQNTFQ
jgi:hypothetical protein